VRIIAGSYALCVFGLMRVCFLVRGVVEAGCFPSSDLAEINLAVNVWYGVRCWCMYYVLVCFFRRRLRFALFVSLCDVGEGLLSV
jgi:hypothetical protein